VINYSEAEDIEQAARSIVAALNFSHVDLDRLRFIRSRGSRSRTIIARIHGLSQIWRQTLDSNLTYIIEVLSEQYDALSKDDKDKIIIHELLHIPMSFGGGLRPHRKHVTRRQVEKFHKIYSSVVTSKTQTHIETSDSRTICEVQDFTLKKWLQNQFDKLNNCKQEQSM